LIWFESGFEVLPATPHLGWGERFKSVIVENGETLINCLAYIDLNPIRAGLVKRQEEYRWNSIGYHAQTNNRDNFLSSYQICVIFLILS
jgi:hypothetical protein